MHVSLREYGMFLILEIDRSSLMSKFFRPMQSTLRSSQTLWVCKLLRKWPYLPLFLSIQCMHWNWSQSWERIGQEWATEFGHMQCANHQSLYRIALTNQVTLSSEIWSRQWQVHSYYRIREVASTQELFIRTKPYFAWRLLKIITYIFEDTKPSTSEQYVMNQLVSKERSVKCTLVCEISWKSQ